MSTKTVTFFLSLMFFSAGCDNSVSSIDKTGVLGEWVHSDTGESTVATMTLCINESGGYLAEGFLCGENVSWLVLTERGVWDIGGGKLFLNPEECEEINYETGLLETRECSGVSAYVYKKNTLSDGEVVLERKK